MDSLDSKAEIELVPRDVTPAEFREAAQAARWDTTTIILFLRGRPLKERVKVGNELLLVKWAER